MTTINPSEIDLTKLPSIPLKKRNSLPEVNCVYFAVLNGVVQYIGKSVNLRKRWLSHHHLFGVNPNSNIAWLEISNPDLLPELELTLIKWFNPPLNSQSIHENSVSISYFRSNISALTRKAKTNNQEIIVTRHGKPFFKIVKFSKDQKGCNHSLGDARNHTPDFLDLLDVFPCVFLTSHDNPRVTCIRL